jgi:DNA topoisomerase-1
MVDKETQPPSRISQGKLIEMMEELGLGTKATRPDIIQKLYDRGYVYNNPPEPSETGIAMYKAFKEHVLRMATPEMTAELERDMDQIAAGETSRDDVLQISREMLHGTYDDLFERREDLAKVIWAGMDEDKFIGPCKVCEEAGRAHEDGSPNRLRIIEMRGGKRFVGCEGYNRDNPEDPSSCTFSRPLPGRGYELWRFEERCSICGETPRLKVKSFRGRPWNLCLNDDCPTMIEMREKRAERQKAKEEAAKRKEAEEAKKGTAADSTAASPNGKKGKGRARKAPKTTTRTKRARTPAGGGAAKSRSRSRSS